MDPFDKLNKQQNGKSQKWELEALDPPPEEEWQRLQDFLGLGQADIKLMLQTVEPLFKRGHELVVGTYNYLLKDHETAAILGWEQGADPEHLAERRRFFTIWLARTLGLDFSSDFARYLFRAGRFHAGDGPRQIHVPELYVTGSISLVNATFARFLTEEMPQSKIVPAALAAWNKVLSLHLHMMMRGYHAAVALKTGDFAISLSLFGKMRSLVGDHKIDIHLPQGAQVSTALQKFFNYYPHLRTELFDIDWLAGERTDASGKPWLTTEKSYKIKPMWRVLLNGQDLSYIGGPDIPVAETDKISIFPPGR